MKWAKKECCKLQQAACMKQGSEESLCVGEKVNHSGAEELNSHIIKLQHD